METSKYNQIAESLKPKKTVLKHCIYAFVYGGAIGAIGQFFLELYMNIFEIDQQEATPMMIITIVLIAAILTGFGIYDRLGKKAGAGTFIPITGFANSMTFIKYLKKNDIELYEVLKDIYIGSIISAYIELDALEAKSEGLVTGIGANMFKLGGTVITFGIVASFVLGGIRYVISLIW